MSQPAKNADGKADPPSEHLGIAGSGTIACGLAAAAAESGIGVTLWARSAASAERARESLGADVDVDVTGDLDALERATVAIEAVLEELDVKEETLRALAERADPGTLLASTTSSLSVERL